ncbi:Mite allergen Der p 3 [Smittium mucronatum]|uniref:Mite allergen Der p 3 n=1 Tax=Smittium mucronatum TaxID=133383 RepID=A0A1R0GW48_9FUNG|nr:Mite allergen Der p 3 [Smittium mucronatum]
MNTRLILQTILSAVALAISIAVGISMISKYRPQNLEEKLDRAVVPLNSDRIVGGKLVVANEFPFAAVLKIDVGSSRYTCGGTIISEKFIVTAAHCMYATARGIKPSELEIGVGNPDLTLAGWVKAKKILVHPDYNGLLITNDIALIELNEPLSFNDTINRAQIDLSLMKKGSEMTVIGWGVTSNESKTSSKVLEKTDLYVQDPAKCAPVRKDFNSNDLDIVCISNTENHKDTCYGDSGGPALSAVPSGNTGPPNSKVKYNLVGITSYGDSTQKVVDSKGRPECGSDGATGFYTRVGFFLKFIAANTKLTVEYLVANTTSSGIPLSDKFSPQQSALTIDN